MLAAVMLTPSTNQCSGLGLFSWAMAQGRVIATITRIGFTQDLASRRHRRESGWLGFDFSFRPAVRPRDRVPDLPKRLFNGSHSNKKLIRVILKLNRFVVKIKCAGC